MHCFGCVRRIIINIMSIYSGFATRFQQQAYDHCIDSLLYVLQKRIMKFYQNQQADEEKFTSIVVKLHHQMRNMEKNKYLEPKSSQAVNQLVKFMQNWQENMLANPMTQPQRQYVSEQLPEIEQKPTLPDLMKERKKSTHWVEKQPSSQAHSNRVKTLSQQQDKTIGEQMIKNVPESKGVEQKPQFKRTYQVPKPKTFNIKGTSRTNISKSRQQKYGNLQEKQRTSKAVSNYILEKPPIQSKVAYNINTTPTEANYNIQKRKPKSISKASNQGQPQIGNQNEVADIIKDYIIKAKKNSKRGDKESSLKLHDF